MSGVKEDTPKRHSSSPDLSSPPSGSSPPHPILPSSNHGPQKVEVVHVSSASGGVTEDGEKAAKKVAARDASASKRRKKRESDGQTASTANSPALHNGVDPKPKKPRIPRGTGPQAMKKKAELEAKRAAEAAALQAAHQTQFIDGFPRPTPPPALSAGLQLPNQNGKIEAIPTSQQFIHQSLTPQPRPSSGQNYDPIRSATVAPRPTSPMNVTNTPPKPTPTITTTTRSPSISSLIDPPDTMRSYTSYVQAPKRESEHRPPSPQDSKRPRLSPPSFPPSIAAKSPLIYSSGYNTLEAPRPISLDDSHAPALAAKQPIATLSKKPTPTTSKGPSPGSHSPKPAPRKEAAALPTAGSGLLSGSVFGASGGLDSSAPEKSAPTVVINVPLTSDNQYINFTRLAEEKYGFNALHPRLAAQRDRLARVAAAGAALENANKNGGSGMSGDEMSVDLSNDEADNSNVEMGGLDGGLLGVKSGEDTGEQPKRRKRIMKEDMYDKDDDFIDDTEQAWEEQAAVSKDGFFVYSGPLVPEGEEAKVDRAENAPKRGGRGTGRGGRGGGGPGSRTKTGIGKDTKDGKPIQKRTRRSKEQIEQDNLREAQRKAQKESFTLLASKPAPTYVSSQVLGMQMTT